MHTLTHLLSHEVDDRITNLLTRLGAGFEEIAHHILIDLAQGDQCCRGQGTGERGYLLALGLG